MKYHNRNIKMHDLEQKGGAAKLERDGYSREQIMKTMHYKTEGCSVDEKRDLVSNLFDRSKG